ncbi:DDE-type integrase/transposase/recombinase, partial [Vibrio sp. PNB22_8_1]|uniref:DDE-type integrase/transposase/recombinase n=1 Tax=unclassified Vibrio TaxID=2614977 RepID=UPI00406A5D7C
SRSWRMDETYIKVKGKWHYYFRAVDKCGNVIDYYLSENRDEAASKAFLNKAIAQSGLPRRSLLMAAKV